MDRPKSTRKPRNRGNFRDYFDGEEAQTAQLLRPNKSSGSGTTSHKESVGAASSFQLKTDLYGAVDTSFRSSKNLRPQTAGSVLQQDINSTTLKKSATGLLDSSSPEKKAQLKMTGSMRSLSRNFDMGTYKVDAKAIRTDTRREFDSKWLNPVVAINAMGRSANYQIAGDHHSKDDFYYDVDNEDPPTETFEPKFNIFQDYDRIRHRRQERLAKEEDDRRKYFEGKPLPKEIAPTEDYRNCYNTLMNDIVRTQVRRIGTLRENGGKVSAAAGDGSPRSRPGSPTLKSGRKDTATGTVVSGFGGRTSRSTAVGGLFSSSPRKADDDIYDSLVTEYEDYDVAPDYSQFSPRSALLRESSRRRVLPFAIREILMSTANMQQQQPPQQQHPVVGDDGRRTTNEIAARSRRDASSDERKSQKEDDNETSARDTAADTTNNVPGGTSAAATPAMDNYQHSRGSSNAQVFFPADEEGAQSSFADRLLSNGLVIDSDSTVVSVGDDGNESSDLLTKDKLKSFLKQSVKVANHKLVSINVNNRGLGDERACCLSAALSACPHLTSLGVAGNRLTDVSINPLLKAVFALSRISFLDLSDNKLDTESIMAFKVLEDRSCRLHELVLSKSDIDDSECAKLMGFLCNNHTLRTLNLSHNVIGGKEDYNTVFPDFVTGGEAIATMLTMNKTLTSLDLSWNKIRAATAMTFVQSIEENNTLKSLNLAYNCIGDSAAQHLAHRMRTNVSLTSLNVAHNSISGKGILVFANALEHNEHLLELNLNGNTIGLLGARSLLRTMRVRSSEGGHLHILFRESNMQYANTSDQLFDCCAITSKKYTLTMSDPYDYAVAQYLLQNANAEPFAKFENIRWQKGSYALLAKPPPGTKIVVKRAAPSVTRPFTGSSADYSMKPLPVKTAASSATATFSASAAAAVLTSWTDHLKSISAAIDKCVKQHKECDKLLARNKRKEFKIALKSDDMEASRQSARTAITALADSMGLCPIVPFIERVRIALQNLPSEKRKSIQQVFKIMFQVAFRMLDRDKSGSIGLEGMITCVSLLGLPFVPLYNPKLKSDVKRVQAPRSPLSGGILRKSGLNIDLADEYTSSSTTGAQTIAAGGGPPYNGGTYNDHEEVLNLADRLLSQMDPGNKGKVSEDDFVRTFFFSVVVDSTPCSAGTLVSSDSNRPWVLPQDGVLEFDYYNTRMPPTSDNIQSDEGVLRYADIVFETLSAALSGEGRLTMVQAAVGIDMYLTAAQANIMLDRLDEKHHGKVKGAIHLSLLEFLMPQLANPTEVCRFLTQNCTFEQIATLRRKMGSAFRAMCGNACGHYILDLSRPVDRIAARKLADLNAIDKNRDTALSSQQRDTSQAGDRENFRNESLNGKYKRLSSEVMQTALPTAGKLRFDFVTTARPVHGVQPCTQDKLAKVIRGIFRKFRGAAAAAVKSKNKSSLTSNSMPKAPAANSRSGDHSSSVLSKWTPAASNTNGTTNNGAGAGKALSTGRKISPSSDSDDSGDDGIISDLDSLFSDREEHHDDELHPHHIVVVASTAGTAAAAAAAAAAAGSNKSSTSTGILEENRHQQQLVVGKTKVADNKNSRGGGDGGSSPKVPAVSSLKSALKSSTTAARREGDLNHLPGGLSKSNHSTPLLTSRTEGSVTSRATAATATAATKRSRTNSITSKADSAASGISNANNTVSSAAADGPHKKIGGGHKHAATKTVKTSPRVSAGGVSTKGVQTALDVQEDYHDTAAGVSTGVGGTGVGTDVGTNSEYVTRAPPLKVLVPPLAAKFSIGIAEGESLVSEYAPESFSAALKLAAARDILRARAEGGEDAVQSLLLGGRSPHHGDEEGTATSAKTNREKPPSTSPIIDTVVFSLGPSPAASGGVNSDYVPTDFKSALQLASMRDLKKSAANTRPSTAATGSSTAPHSPSESNGHLLVRPDYSGDDSLDRDYYSHEISNGALCNGDAGTGSVQKTDGDDDTKVRESSISNSALSRRASSIASPAPNDNHNNNSALSVSRGELASSTSRQQQDHSVLGAPHSAAGGTGAGAGAGVGQRFLRGLSNQRKIPPSDSVGQTEEESIEERIIPGSARELWLDTCKTSWEAYKHARTKHLFHVLKAAIEETYKDPTYTNADTLTVLLTAYKTKVFKDLQNLPVYCQELDYRKDPSQAAAYGAKPTDGGYRAGAALASKSKKAKGGGGGLGVGGGRLEMVNRANRVMRRAVAGLRCQPNSFERYATEIGARVLKALGIDEIDDEEFEDGLINRRFSLDASATPAAAAAVAAAAGGSGKGTAIKSAESNEVRSRGAQESDAPTTTSEQQLQLQQQQQGSSGGDVAQGDTQHDDDRKSGTGNGIGIGNGIGNGNNDHHNNHAAGGRGVSVWHGPSPVLLNHCQLFEQSLILLEVFLVYHTWFSVAQVISLLREFIERSAPDEVLVRLVCIVFNRIIDLENFGDLMRELPIHVRLEINHRLGILNTLVPLKPDGHYEFDMAARDHREAAKILTRLAVIESRENFSAESYSPSLVQPLIPHWQLPFRWTLPDNPRQGDGPKSCGYMSLTWTSLEKDGKGFAVMAARKELTIVRTLAGSRGIFSRPLAPPPGMVRDYSQLKDLAAKRMQLRSNALIQRSHSDARLISRALSRRLSLDVEELEEQMKIARSLHTAPPPSSLSVSPVKIMRSLSRSASIRALRLKREVSFAFIGSEDGFDPQINKDKDDAEEKRLKLQMQSNLMKSMGGRGGGEGEVADAPDSNNNAAAAPSKGRGGGHGGEAQEKKEGSSSAGDASLSAGGYESALSDDSWFSPTLPKRDRANDKTTGNGDDDDGGDDLANQGRGGESSFPLPQVSPRRPPSQQKEEEEKKEKGRNCSTKTAATGRDKTKKLFLLLTADELDASVAETDDFAAYDISDYKYSSKVEKFQRAPWLGPKA